MSSRMEDRFSNRSLLFCFTILLVFCCRLTQTQTWTFRQQLSVPNSNWKSVAMSNDGQYMYVVAPENVYQSTDGGSTWDKINQNLYSLLSRHLSPFIITYPQISRFLKKCDINRKCHDSERSRGFTGEGFDLLKSIYESWFLNGKIGGLRIYCRFIFILTA